MKNIEEPLNTQTYQDRTNSATSDAVIVQPIGVNFDQQPCSLICPTCKANIVTKISRKNGMCTWLLCSALCMLGCAFGCQFIPFCLDRFKDVEHHCPNCNAFLGKKKRF